MHKLYIIMLYILYIFSLLTKKKSLCQTQPRNGTRRSRERTTQRSSAIRAVTRISQLVLCKRTNWFHWTITNTIKQHSTWKIILHSTLNPLEINLGNLEP